MASTMWKVKEDKSKYLRTNGCCHRRGDNRTAAVCSSTPTQHGYGWPNQSWKAHRTRALAVSAVPCLQQTVKKMEGHDIDASYGSLTQLAAGMWFQSLVDSNNDPKDEFHFDLFSPVIIGRDIKPENDIFHLNATFP